MNLKELEQAQRELKEKIQDETIDRLADLVQTYIDSVSKKGYSMTLHELTVFQKIWKQIDFIDKNYR